MAFVDVLKWTKEKPTRPGYYWVYTVPVWEEKPEVYCCAVYLTPSGEPCLQIEADGYEWERKITAERTTHWLGPIMEPAPPEDGS